MSRQPLTPDFITHQWQPIESATLEDGFIRVTWLDGLSFDAYSLWLAENAEGYGLEPLSRESMLEPRMLPDPCLLYTSPSPRDAHESRMPSSA